MADALLISMVLMQLTFVVGSAAGGFVIAWVGLANTYWIDVFSYFVVPGSLFIMFVLRVPAEKRAQAGFSALVDGMLLLRAHPIILAVLSLDFFATFFGSPRALLPVYTVAILHTGAGLGILQASTSIGAIALAPFTGRIGRIRQQGLGVAIAIIGWGICIIAFGLSTGPLLLSALFLAGAGAADMVSMVLRGLIVQMTTPMSSVAAFARSTPCSSSVGRCSASSSRALSRASPHPVLGRQRRRRLHCRNARRRGARPVCQGARQIERSPIHAAVDEEDAQQRYCATDHLAWLQELAEKRTARAPNTGWPSRVARRPRQAGVPRA